MNQYVLMLIVIVFLMIIALNNSTHDLENRSENCWEQMTYYLDKRLDCINQALNIIKSVSPKDITNIPNTEQASQIIKESADICEREQGEKLLNSVIKSIYDKMQTSSNLKDNAELKGIIKEIKNLEDKINNSAELYNELVDKYNKKIKTFPLSIKASVLKLKEIDNFNM